MHIQLDKKEDLTAILEIVLSPEDYQPKIDAAFKKLKREADLPGFRKGNIPSQIIKKRFGQSVLVDEIHKLLNESLTNYLQKERLKIFGEPLTSNDKEAVVDWENPSEFKFYFDLGMIPEIETHVDENIKVPFYTITPDEKIINDYIKNYQHRFGTNEETDAVTDDNNLVYGKFEQLDKDNNPLSEGITVDDSMLLPRYLTDEKTKEELLKLHVGDSFVLNPKEALLEAELPHVFNIKKEAVETVNTPFKFTISKITEFVPAKVDEELFKKAFGEEVKTEEEFKNKVIEEINKNLLLESDYQLKKDLKKVLLEQFSITLPDDFLKRWLVETAKDKEPITDEILEKEYPLFADNLKWSILLDALVKEFDIKIENDEIKAEAAQYTREMFYQYGMYQLTDDQIESYSAEILKNEQEVNKIYDRLKEQKVVNTLKEKVSLDKKEMSLDEFDKISKGEK